MGTLAGHECVDPFIGGFLQVATSSARHHTNALTYFGSAGKEYGLSSNCAFQALNELLTRKSGGALKPQELAMGKEEGPELFQTQRRAKLYVVTQFGMSIEWQVRAIHGKVVVQNQAQQLIRLANP